MGGVLNPILNAGWKTLGERADEAPFGRGVHDGKGDLLEEAGEFDIESSMEEFRDEVPVVAEGAATPGAKD